MRSKIIMPKEEIIMPKEEILDFNKMCAEHDMNKIIQEAKEIVEEFYCVESEMEYELAKKCATIAVNRILSSRPVITDSQIEFNNHYNQVKEEIQKLY
jgi:hypothetical protein